MNVTPLIDTFDRVHDNLRISTLRIAAISRCFYCMPEEGVKFQPARGFSLSKRLSASCALRFKLGVRKLRLTGGEPLLRKGLAQLIELLEKIDGIRDMALTTNRGIAGGSGAGTLRCWVAAVEHSSGYA